MVAFYQRGSTPEGTETMNCDFLLQHSENLQSTHFTLQTQSHHRVFFGWGADKPKLKHHFHFRFYGDDSSAGSAAHVFSLKNAHSRRTPKVFFFF